MSGSRGALDFCSPFIFFSKMPRHTPPHPPSTSAARALPACSSVPTVWAMPGRRPGRHTRGLARFQPPPALCSMGRPFFLPPPHAAASSDASRPPPPAPPAGPSSSSALATRLATAVHAVQAPARFSTRFADALRALADAGLEAYACGWTEGDVTRELVRAGSRDPGAPTDTEASVAYVALVWLTAEAAEAAAAAAVAGPPPPSSSSSSVSLPAPLSAPSSIRRPAAGRWASTAALSPATEAAWAGFVGLIVEANLRKGWVWFPLDRLSTELAASRGGSPPPPAAVAEWARVVYATLETLAGGSGRRGEEGGVR